jgi:Ca-activated chloride channel family protein
VPVAVNVVDANGAPVPGLTAEDFLVTEDGKPQRIAVFDRESSTPLSIVMAIDTSESVLGDERLMREAGRKFVKTILHTQDQLAVLEFADQVNETVPFTNDPTRVDTGLSHFTRGDATALYDGIYLSAEKLQSTGTGNRRRIVVVISDGENTTHHGGYDSALAQLQRAGAMLYPLIVVPVEADPGRNTGGEHALMQLSEDTGGRFYYVKDKRDLSTALGHVSDDLRTQYTVGYYAPQRGGDDNGFRRIALQLKDPTLRTKYTLHYRQGYYAPR